jgi:hypothetical protein
LVGRQSGRYEPSNPFWFNNREIRRKPQHDSYMLSNTQVLPPTNTSTNEQQQYSERMLKTKELQTLLYKHRAYLKQDPRTTLRSIMAYTSIRENDSILDEKLEQFRAFDRGH